MGHEDCPRQQAVDRAGDVLKERRVPDILIVDPGQLNNRVRDLLPGVNLGLKLVDDLTILNQHTANLDDPIAVVHIGPSRLQVDHGVNRRLLITFGAARCFLFLHNYHRISSIIYFLYDTPSSARLSSSAPTTGRILVKCLDLVTSRGRPFSNNQF